MSRTPPPTVISCPHTSQYLIYSGSGTSYLACVGFVPTISNTRFQYLIVRYNGHVILNHVGPLPISISKDVNSLFPTDIPIGTWHNLPFFWKWRNPVYDPPYYVLTIFPYTFTFNTFLIWSYMFRESGRGEDYVYGAKKTAHDVGYYAVVGIFDNINVIIYVDLNSFQKLCILLYHIDVSPFWGMEYAIFKWMGGSFRLACMNNFTKYPHPHVLVAV